MAMGRLVREEGMEHQGKGMGISRRGSVVHAGLWRVGIEDFQRERVCLSPLFFVRSGRWMSAASEDVQLDLDRVCAGGE